MSDPDRIVVEQAHMIDALTSPPPVGMRVHALNKGGVMVQAVWTSESHKFFEAWHPYLKVPQSVKERMSRRHNIQEVVCQSQMKTVTSQAQ